MSEPLDRRARRKQRTHRETQRAALRLFAEHGYDETSIAMIADAADIAPRTVTFHFPTKQDLLFDDDPFSTTSLAEHLQARPTGQNTLDALRDWMATTIATLTADSDNGRGDFWQARALRALIITAHPDLRARARAGYHADEELIATHLAAEHGLPTDALAPRLAALTTATGLRELYFSAEATALEPPDPDALLALVDRVIDFARGGLTAALQAAEPPP